MKFTKNEINRFLALIKSHDHNSAREFLYSDIGRIKTIDISLKNNENKAKKYFQIAFGADPCTHHGARRRTIERVCRR